MIASSIPNFLTVFRFFLVYPIVISILEENYQLTLFFFFLAGISDFLDGYLARKYSWESRFGKIFDPISDKVLVIATLISLSLVGEINIYLTINPKLYLLLDGTKNHITIFFLNHFSKKYH